MSHSPESRLITAAGARIERSSFEIIDQEVGDHPYDERQWPVVRRMIHATADFEFNGLTRFHPAATEAALAALRGGAAIVCDVEMIRVGLSRARMAPLGVAAHQFIDHPEVVELARAEETTRAVQAMRMAWREGLLEGGVVAVGNAPTALLEVLRLVRDEGVRPALIVGMPVGFVSAVESKEELMAQEQVPWIATAGRKGGSTLVVAALNALMILAGEA